MRSLSNEILVDELEADEESIADLMMDDNAIATSARPGTTLKLLQTSVSQSPSTSQSVKPMTSSGVPITGVLRPGTKGNRLNTAENILKAPRTSKTARPITTSSGRFVRLGTVSMLSGGPDDPFINLARLNINKYSAMNHVSKPLFEYIYGHENNIRLSLDLANQANRASQCKDWSWKVALGKCYYKLGMLRDAESQFRSAKKMPESSLDAFLWLGKVYIRLDQPLTALSVYREGLDKFPGETFLMIYISRIHEMLLEVDEAVKIYKEVLNYEATNVEAIACIAMHYFYNDQPEVALRYYRRILQMGTNNAEVYDNIGLCCYYAQQFDMTITCFEKALLYSTEDEITADIWYNIGHVALGCGDKQLATQAFRLALVANNQHSESYNNLGVIVINKENGSMHNVQQAKVYFQASKESGNHLYEPHYNLALIGEKLGNYDLCYQSIKKCLQIYPHHFPSKEIYNRMKEMYESI